MTAKLLRGDVYNGEALSSETQQAELVARRSGCDETIARNIYILRLAIVQQAIAAKDRTAVESGSRALDDAVRRGLSCSPGDAFAWLTLFWLDVVRQGLRTENENYLRLSYAFGANEAWIAQWRSRLAFSLFDRLPEDLSKGALKEFNSILDTGRLFWDAAGTYEHASSAAQGSILQNLTSATPLARRGLGEMLHMRGINVAIPGEPVAVPRPWR